MEVQDGEMCFSEHISISENNKAFRGSSDKLYTSNNGNFLGLLEILVFDLVMQHHIEFVMNGDISDHYCQGYDNGHEGTGANMKGKDNGVQKRILNMKSLGFYLPCGTHTLNVVLCDAAKWSEKTITLFAIIQRLFTIFAAYIIWLEILIANVTILTLKNSRQHVGKQR